MKGLSILGAVWGGLAATWGGARGEEGAEGAEAAEVVKALGNSDFEGFVKEHKHVLVKFYAPWCGHCKKMAGDYESAAKSLLEKDSNVKLAKVDATQHADVAEKYEVRGYPTLLFFRNGASEEYTGGRSAEEIATWLGSMTGEAVVVAATAAETEPSAAHVSHFVGTFKNAESEAAKAFLGVADKSRQMGTFYAVYDASATEGVHVARLKEERHALSGELTSETLSAFVEAENLPLYGPISGDNFRRYFARDVAVAWLCGEPTLYEETEAAVKRVAREFRNQVAFVYLNTDLFKGHAEHNLDVKEFPALVIHGKEGRYVMTHSDTKTPKLDQEIKDYDRIRAFTKAVADGTYPRSYKSEEVPEENNEPVTVVVGKTFEEVVINSPRDVMLEVYAPWCGHCKKLEPIYNDLATKFKDDNQVTIAKMDGTLNEAPNSTFTWQGFPSIFYLKKGETTPLKYEGQRTIDALQDYITKNRTPRAPGSPTSPEVVRDEL